jgi:hypothetical protein
MQQYTADETPTDEEREQELIDFGVSPASAAAIVTWNNLRDDDED